MVQIALSQKPRRGLVFAASLVLCVIAYPGGWLLLAGQEDAMAAASLLSWESTVTKSTTSSSLESANVQRLRATTAQQGAQSPGTTTSASLARSSGPIPLMKSDHMEDCATLKGLVLSKKVIDPNGDGRYQRKTKTLYPFSVSLHSKEFDIPRWDIMMYGRYYERDLEDIWQYVVKKAPQDSLVLDIGGNVGYYSLLSASVRPDVTIHAFEPNPKNRIRFCESIEMNDSFENRIYIHKVGISNKKGKMAFHEDLTNPGAGGLVKVDKHRQRKSYEIPVLTLDDFVKQQNWLTAKPNITVLKIDVERHEAEVVLGAKELLESGIVRNIFTETSAEAIRMNPQLVKDSLLLLSKHYTLVGKGNFRGPSKSRPHDWPAKGPELVDKIIENVSGAHTKGHLFLNLWWSLDNVSPHSIPRGERGWL